MPIIMSVLVSLALAAIPEPEETLVFQNGDLGSKYYRIPAVLCANDGSLVTTTDQRWDSSGDLPGKIWVLGRRSTDSGKTWEDAVKIAGSNKGFGDASLVKDKKTGTIITLMNANNGLWQSTPENPMRLYHSRSTDNGKTWSEPIEFTDQIYAKNCTDPERKTWKAMFISSGNTLQLRDGRIMAVIVIQKKTGMPLHNHVIYSDDLGFTWHVGGLACDGGDESKVVELNNGDVLMSIRHSPRRLFAISHDRGLTWDPYYKMEDIHDPACDGDIIRYTSTIDGYDKNRLIHTVPYAGSRMNVSILISYDEGKTWPVKKVICPGGSVYSSAAILPDGRIAVYYERNRKDKNGLDMIMTTFTLEWATDGADTYTPPKP